jgi:hypothetical protein
VGRAIPVRRVRFPSTSATTASFREGGHISVRLSRMKKLILLIVLVALGAVAAKKIKAT